MPAKVSGARVKKRTPHRGEWERKREKCWWCHPGCSWFIYQWGSMTVYNKYRSKKISYSWNTVFIMSVFDVWNTQYTIPLGVATSRGKAARMTQEFYDTRVWEKCRLGKIKKRKIEVISSWKCWQFYQIHGINLVYECVCVWMGECGAIIRCFVEL